MATQRAISTISYNTEEFLKEKLNNWYNAHIISYYMYICHKGEDGDKDHIHVFIQPNKRLDTMDLQADLRQWVTDSDKPLGVRPFRQSDEENWLLYAVHDEEYLRTKYADDSKEKLPYKIEDVKVSDYFDIDTAFIRAKSKLAHTGSNICKRLRDGEKPADLILKGESAFTVNAILRVMREEGNSELVAQLQFYMDRCALLESAIDNANMVLVCDEDGNASLEKAPINDI